jgi:hypothetical protein
MTLDERTRQVYSALDDTALLTLLLVLRTDMDRHLQQLSTVGDAYRQAVGPDAPEPRNLREILEGVGAAGAEARRDEIESVPGLMRSEAEEMEMQEALDDTAAWERYTVVYSRDLAEREFWVRTELARRGLIPDPDYGTGQPAE